MLILEEMKKLGIEITSEMEKKFSGDWVTQFELERKTKKLTKLEEDNKELEKQCGDLEKELKDLKDSTEDVESLRTKVTELTTTLETERRERADREEQERLTTQVTEFFEGKHFVNEITADAIRKTLVEELQKDTAKGRSISDLFDAIVKDDKGEYKPNILITDKELEAQKNRSQIVGNNIHQQTGARLSTAELMKMKNQNPDMYITPYLKQ